MYEHGTRRPSGEHLDRYLEVLGVLKDELANVDEGRKETTNA
jgi:hypothetical protein